MKFINVVVIFTFVSTSLTAAGPVENAVYWKRKAQENIARTINDVPNKNIAKNVLLFIGDGMGLSTVMAARVLKGQLQNETGEEAELAFEKFPHVGLMKVYTVDKQVPDSAATATAMLSGVKTNSMVLGFDASVTYDKCHIPSNARVSTMLNWSQTAGKSTGIVTNTRITHATPAAAYASVPNRNWESDRDVPRSTEPHCTDIASQLIYNNSNIHVLLGGGRQNFIPTTVKDPNTGSADIKKQRLDGEDLIEAWKTEKRSRNVSHNFAWTKGQLDNINANETDYLLGLFAKSHMEYELLRKSDPNGEPSLAEMTKKAIEILQKNNNGFFLLVEGGRIDHAHHETKAKHALYETLAFEEAVQVGLNMTLENDTLVIVTADHSHTMTVSGYPDRGNGILDIVRPLDYKAMGTDKLPYTAISYANGPYNKHPRKNLTNVDTYANDFQQNSVVPMEFETHSGEDVPIYSRGPMSHLLTGVNEQNTIAYVMAHAACVGHIGLDCEMGRTRPTHTQKVCGHINKNGGTQIIFVSNTFFVIPLFIYFYQNF